MKITPSTKLGKLSAMLQILFLLSFFVSISLLNISNRFSDDDRWWDVIAPIIFIMSIIASILGVYSIKKCRDDCIFVYASIFVGVLVIFFIFTHSLFISD